MNSIKQSSSTLTIQNERLALPRKKCSIYCIVSPLLVVGKYICQRIAYCALYPPQNSLVKCLKKEFSERHLESLLERDFKVLASKGYNTRRVTFEKNGMQYYGAIVSAGSKSDNWIVQITGRTAPIETSIRDIALKYLPVTSGNLLMLNAPNIGKNRGQTTFRSAGELQSLALCFLEKNGAKKIALVGHSFGASILSEAVMNHAFCEKIEYIVIRQMGFCRISEAAKAFTGLNFVGHILRFLEIETDELAASQILAKQEIPDFILQASTSLIGLEIISDGVIPANCSLASACLKNKCSKVIGLGRIGHADDAVWQTTAYIIKSYWDGKKEMDFQKGD